VNQKKALKSDNDYTLNIHADKIKICIVNVNTATDVITSNTVL